MGNNSGSDAQPQNNQPQNNQPQNNQPQNNQPQPQPQNNQPQNNQPQPQPQNNQPQPQPDRPNVTIPGAGQRSPATLESAAKRDAMVQNAQSFRTTYGTDQPTPPPFYPNAPVSGDDLLAEYDALEQRRAQLSTQTAVDPAVSNQLNADYAAYFQKLRQPEHFNKAYSQVVKLLQDNLVKPVEGLGEVSDKLKANKFNYSLENEKLERSLLNDVKKTAEADRYLNLLLGASFIEEEDPIRHTKTAREDPKMMAFYRQAKSLLDTTVDMGNGRLCVPPDELTTENGKTIHRTSLYVWDKDGNVVINHLNYDESHSQKAMNSLAAEYNAMKPFVEMGIQTQIAVLPARYTGPIFKHEPCPEDVQQGTIGDCYMISVLQAISSQDPDFIKSAIVKNEDESVTVRFFNEKNEPVYVTIDDAEDIQLLQFTVNNPDPAHPEYLDRLTSDSTREPEEKYSNYEKDKQAEKARKKAEKQAPKTAPQAPRPTGPVHPKVDPPIVLQKKERIMARQSHWVALLERAFVESGLRQERTSVYEKSPTEYAGNYQGIEAFRSIEFAKFFLGPHMNPVSEKEIPLPKSRTKGWGEYSKEEKDFLKRIGDDVHAGRAVFASKQHQLSQDKNSPYSSTNGLPGNHAYSVFDVKNEGGKLYVGILDPNRMVQRVYDDQHTPYMYNRMEHPGESWIELHEFCQDFHRVHALDMTKGIVNRDRFRDAGELERIYGEAVKGLCRDILEQNSKLAYLSNSNQYNKLAEAAENGLKAFNSEHPDPETMKKAIRELSAKAGDYLTARNNKPKKEANELKQVSAARYFAAESLARLGQKFEANNASPLAACNTIELHELKSEVLQTQPNPQNKAQMAAHQYQRLLQQKTNLIQSLRESAGFRTADDPSRNEYTVPAEKMAQLLYVETLLKQRAKISVDQMENAMSENVMQQQVNGMLTAVSLGVQGMDREQTRKDLFSPNADQRLYAHYLEGAKVSAMSPEKQAKIAEQRTKQKAAEQKTWEDSVQKERRQGAANAKKLRDLRTMKTAAKPAPKAKSGP